MTRNLTSPALLLATWMLLSLPVIAEEKVRIRSNEELLQKALEDSSHWPKRAIYLYAYVQRNPEQMNDPSHAAKVIGDLREAVTNVERGLPAGSVGGPPGPEWEPELWREVEGAPPCSASSEEICKQYGATCEVDVGIDGEANDLCRWWRISDPDQCQIAGGIWTTASSKFALRHPDAVKPGLVGACVSQSKNLRRRPWTDDGAASAPSNAGFCG